jgi:hypothetical protein
MKRNRFDLITMFLFLINTIMTIIDGNYIAALGWACALLTIGRILLNNVEQE